MTSPVLTLSQLTAAARRCFHRVHGSDAHIRVAVSPGRVNLIGEHTDYNDGFVLPMALDRYIAVAFAPNEADVARIHSMEYGASVELPLGELSAPGGSNWFDYITGIFWAMRSEGYRVPGLDLVITGNIPIGAGLSSSAAIEVATARAVAAAAGHPWDAKRMAKTAQKAENEYVGMPCGIMDQLAVSAGEEGSALLLDCRSLETSTVPIPDEVLVVVMDTGTRRALADGAYAERRGSCERAVAVLRRRRPTIGALRDVTLDMLEDVRETVGAEDFARALHVITENQRTRDMADTLMRGELERSGTLMNASHESLRDLYQVSSRELDVITGMAREHPACWGARMTGAGFGGCGVALVRIGEVDAFVADVATAYREETSLPGVLYVCRPVAGARLV